ncbi:MAG: hypothetical protein K8R69_03985, partial [Deltaproteobacteria bacterium]|nr:hypothetical protein [Deltaproteobacteria bacterium]
MSELHLKSGLFAQDLGSLASKAPAPEAEVRTDAAGAEFERLLAPLVPGLLRDSQGGLALDRFPRGSESEFREYLAEQLSLNDGFSFRDPVAGLVKEERFRPLVKALYDQTRGLPPASIAPNLLSQFQSALINLDAQGFVKRLWGSEGGIEKLQAILENASGDYSDEVLAELNKGISAAYQQDKQTLSHVMSAKMNQVFSRWNFWNWDIRKEELLQAKEISGWMLDRVQDFQRERAQKASPKNLKGTPLFNGGSQRKRVGPEDYAQIQTLIEQKSSRTDALSLSEAALGKLWCFAAENSNWIDETLGDTIPARLHLLQGAEALLEEAKRVRGPEDFKAYNEKLQKFLKGPIADESKAGWLLWLQDVTIGAGLPAALEKMQPNSREPFDQLLQSTDKWTHAMEMGTEVYRPVAVETKLGPESASELQLQAGKENLVRSLEDLKGELWHGYKQHGLLSRMGSAWAGEVLNVGDKQDIQQAIGEIQVLVESVRGVENLEDYQKTVTRLTAALKPDGKLNRGFKAAEMDGVENVLGQVDQAAEMLALALVTEGAGTGVAVARLMKAGKDFKTAMTAAKGMREAATVATQASRMEKAYAGFKAGATNSLVHNAVSKATSQARQGDDTAANWIKDATATGLASGMTGAFAKAGLAHGNPVKNILSRYTTG